MEEVISRFPHIAEQIFEELDNDNFIQCKVMSQSWKNFIEGSKFSYIRLITATINCSKKDVEKIFPKANLEEIMRLASDVTNVYNELKVYDPSLKLLHLAALHAICGRTCIKKCIRTCIRTCKNLAPNYYIIIKVRVQVRSATIKELECTHVCVRRKRSSQLTPCTYL